MREGERAEELVVTDPVLATAMTAVAFPVTGELTDVSVDPLLRQKKGEQTTATPETSISERSKKFISETWRAWGQNLRGISGGVRGTGRRAKRKEKEEDQVDCEGIAMFVGALVIFHRVYRRCR